MTARLLAVLILGTFAAGLAAGSGSAHSGFIVTSGHTSTPPIIDGILGAEEWASASSFPFAIQTVSGTAYIAHDDTYVYVGATIADPSSGLNSFGLIFDNNHDGAQNAGDDALVVNLGNNSAFDDFFNGTCCYLFDTSAGGTNDITAFGSHDAAQGIATFELRHPLCSADTAHDICLSPGSVVGFNIVYQPGDGAFYSGFPSLAPFNTAAFGDLRIPGTDTTPPTVTVTATPSILWPPDHRLVPVSLSVSASDDTGVASVVLLSVTSNEPDNGLGDGETTNDIQDAALGSLDTNILLRAERGGSGSGRVYTITYQATDLAGNVATASAEVLAPLNRTP